ncbi:unnamed protein product [Auanema sp. JU1783]|nr:unnamed protein product [Auanema sp. JU1783]
MYLLITVPTKLTTFSRCVIHGHDIASGFTQISLTIFLQPHIILPCTSGYSTGLLTRLDIMSTINQSWCGVLVLSSCGWATLLLVIHRVISISVNLSDRKKKIILIVFFSQLFVQSIAIVVGGLNVEDGGEKAKAICMEKLEDYPKEMDTFHGLNFAYSRAKQRKITIGIIYFGIIKIVSVGVPIAILITCSCLNIGSVGVSHYATISVGLYPMIGPYYVLLSNPEYRKRVIEITTRARKVTILQPGKSSQSAQFLANQRRITVGIIYFLAVELVGVGVPAFILVFCAIFNIGNLVVAHFSILLICIYPISGPYYVLMSNPDYSKRVNEIRENFCSRLCSFRSARKVASVPSVETVTSI